MKTSKDSILYFLSEKCLQNLSTISPAIRDIPIASPKMITTGVVDEDLLQLKIGEVDHSRWLNTGNRFEHLWVSNYGLAGDNLRDLRVVVQFLASFHFPMWFEIKADSSIISGPYHKLKKITNLIPSLLSSDKDSDRRFAIEKLTSLRHGVEFGDKVVCLFIPPKLNWNTFHSTISSIGPT